MTSLTPYRDAADAALQSMNEGIDAMLPHIKDNPRAVLGMEVTRQLNMPLARLLADALDKRMDRGDAGMAIAAGLSNVIASTCSTIARGDDEHARTILAAMMIAISGKAELAILHAVEGKNSSSQIVKPEAKPQGGVQ